MGSRERSPPATERAGEWPPPGPQHPLFAQPAPAGENKQGKVNAEGEGAEALAAPARSPPQPEQPSEGEGKSSGLRSLRTALFWGGFGDF